MALYIPRSIFHLVRLLYVRPWRFGPTLIFETCKIDHINYVWKKIQPGIETQFLGHPAHIIVTILTELSWLTHDNVVAVMMDSLTDVDKVLFHLEAKEFTVEPSTLQSLQQLIQWVADLALNLLARLPEQRQPGKSSGVRHTFSLIDWLKSLTWCKACLQLCGVDLSDCIWTVLQLLLGVCSSTVALGTALQARRSRVQFQMISFKFFIDIILWPWGQLSL